MYENQRNSWWLDTKPTPKFQPKPGQRIKPLQPPKPEVNPFAQMTFCELLEVAWRLDEENKTLRQYVNEQPLIG